MGGRVFEQQHRVKYYECDTTQKLTLPMLINVALHASGVQGHRLGVGDDVVAEKGLAWIIIQYEVLVERMPDFFELITVTTQATSYNKLFCYRQFKLYGADNELCVTINSTFALIDTVNRKMARIPEDIVAPYEAPFSKKLIRTAKPDKVAEENFSSTDYRVRYLDIDRNRHVNNSKYFEWTMDTLDYAFLTTHKLDYANIKFEKEVYYGNLIQSLKSEKPQSDGKVITSHRIVTGEMVNCEASFLWSKTAGD